MTKIEVDLRDLWLALSGANSDSPREEEYDAAIRLWEQIEPLMDEREALQSARSPDGKSAVIPDLPTDPAYWTCPACGHQVARTTYDFDAERLVEQHEADAHGAQPSAPLAMVASSRAVWDRLLVRLDGTAKGST